MKEQEIQSYFMRKCRENGIYAVKLIATSKRGVADVMVIHKGVYLIEFKTNKGRQSEAQKIFQSICEMNGVKYLIIQEKEQCDEVIKKILLCTF
jgi:hypothetical protein